MHLINKKIKFGVVFEGLSNVTSCVSFPKVSQHFSYLDSLSLRHQRILRGSSIGMFQLRLRSEHFVRKGNEHTHCSRCSLLTGHLRQILLGSRSDDRLRDLCRLSLGRRHLGMYIRRCRYIHHMDFLGNLRDRGTCSCQHSFGNRR